jgi:hypothetical protein
METKINTEAKQRVCRILKAGGTLRAAAGLIGCTERGLQYAIKRDPDFEKQAWEARNESELESLEALAESANSGKSWRGPYHRLRLLYPDIYGRRPEELTAKYARKILHDFREQLDKVVTHEPTRIAIGNLVARTQTKLQNGRPVDMDEPNPNPQEPPSTSDKH